MAYIKGTLVGIVALLIAIFVYGVTMIIVLSRKYAPPPVGEINFDLLSIFNRPSFWVIALAVFALGFYWEVRRAM
jgi:hypothetical protein